MYIIQIKKTVFRKQSKRVYCVFCFKSSTNVAAYLGNLLFLIY